MRHQVWWMLLLNLLCLLFLLPNDQRFLLWAQTQRPSRGLAQSPPAGGPPSGGTVQTQTRSNQITGILLQNDLLSVDVREQDIRGVIETIASQGSIEVQHLDGLPSTPISIRFASLPVAQGLQRLLRAAAIPGYVLVTAANGETIAVRRILFLASNENPGGSRPFPMARRASPTLPQPPSSPPAPPTPGSQPAEGEREEPLQSSGASVFDDIKTNTTARRLLSQLVHPNEQVRERALERLVQLVGEDQKQAELLEVLEPIMDELASEDKGARDEARAELRKLLSR